MKNLPWILTAILALAVINLYFKVYNLTGPSKSASMTASDGSATLRLAYVNADSILENFTQFRKEKDVLDKKQMDIDVSLGSKGRTLENEVASIQQKIQSGLLTPKEIQQQEQRFSARQQALMAERDKLAKEVMDEGTAINERLQKVLMASLETLKKIRATIIYFLMSKEDRS
ncbi:MAG: OmpH family outer membrane protein [Saprospiraceae bacterium]|nr:OmpH family outer membrane protein [Saprospiraceae bacterium]